MKDEEKKRKKLLSELTTPRRQVEWSERLTVAPGDAEEVPRGPGGTLPYAGGDIALLHRPVRS